MGQLDTQTLLFASIFIYFLISFLLLLAAFQTKRDPCLLWIAAGFSILGFAAIVIALRIWSSWLLLVIWISNILIILTHGCIWSALRRFAGKKVKWDWMLLAPVLWVLLCLLWPNFTVEPVWRVLAFTLIATFYLLFALREIQPFWRKNSQTTLPLTMVLIGIILFYNYRLALTVGDFQFWSLDPDAEITLFVAMIMFICLSFTTLMLVRGREEYQHKLAALQDSLTQIPNRRALFDQAPITIQKAVNQQKEVALLMCDLDNFKKINDQYGHDIGDQVLKLFAQVLKDVVAEQGYYARLGGEEFVMLFMAKSLPEINELALNVLQELACRSKRELSICVTSSIGIATATQAGYNLHKLLICADEALYQAKADNRNCVRMWSSDGLSA